MNKKEIKKKLQEFIAEQEMVIEDMQKDLNIMVENIRDSETNLNKLQKQL